MGVVVAVAHQAGAREQPGIEQRGMVQPVFEHRVAPAHQRLGEPEVGHVAGGEQQRTRIAGERGEFIFERVVRARMAVDQVGRAAADAIASNALDKSRPDIGVVGQPEIVIAAKADDLIAVDHHLGLLRPVADAS